MADIREILQTEIDAAPSWKNIYKIIQELVLIGIDSAESQSKLPDIELTIEETSLKEIELYFYEKSSQVVEENKSTNDSYYKIVCKHKEIRLDAKDIPLIFGFSSPACGLRQSRRVRTSGFYVLLCSRNCTEVSFLITTSIDFNKYSTYSVKVGLEGKIDVEPFREIQNINELVGSQYEVYVQGSYNNYQVFRFLHLMCMATPKLKLKFEYSDLAGLKKVLSYGPPENLEDVSVAKITNYHPSAINIGQLDDLIKRNEEKDFKSFLKNDFSNVDEKKAKEIISKMGEDVNSEMKVKALLKKNVFNLRRLFKNVKFPGPDGSCLRAVGKVNFSACIMTRYSPEHLGYYQSNIAVHNGHPYRVEVCVTVGGYSSCVDFTVKKGVNIFGFANCVPLLFEEIEATQRKNKKKIFFFFGTCCQGIKWSQYRIDLTREVCVVVNIVSTKLPLKGLLEECFEDVEDMSSTIKSSIIASCKDFSKTYLAEKCDEKNLYEQLVLVTNLQMSFGLKGFQRNKLLSFGANQKEIS